METIVESGRTRFPVYDGTLDRVIGILYVKDLIPFFAQQKIPEQPLKELMRHAWTVPVDRDVEALLMEFLNSRSHMAVVLDEFQQMVGVVTIEDALEEIVGEIVDESDEEEEFGIDLIDASTVQVEGRVMMDDLNECTGWNLPERDEHDPNAK
jgi:CBS domain containing-hemolysin-like protein